MVRLFNQAVEGKNTNYKQPEYWPNLTMGVFKGRALVLVPTVDTYVEFRYIKYFSANKCQHFEGMGRTLWSVLVLSNALKGLPSAPCGQGIIFFTKKTNF